jgi:hypothetical protein
MSLNKHHDVGCREVQRVGREMIRTATGLTNVGSVVASRLPPLRLLKVLLTRRWLVDDRYVSL